MKKIYQFGLIRSGTNYTRKLLELNLSVKTANYDIGCKIQPWKHGAVSTDITDGISICTVRHPLSWLYAVYRYDYKDIYSFKDWIFYNYSNRERQMPYIPLWSMAVLYWLSYSDTIIRFEDILFFPEKTVDLLSSELKLKRLSKKVKVPEKRVDPKKDNAEKHNRKVIQREKNKNFMDKYDKETADYVWSCMDRNITKVLGYEKNGDTVCSR